MVDVSNAPLFSPHCTGSVRFGDPIPYDADPRFYVLPSPYPNPTGYASWRMDGQGGWETKTTIDDSCLFQINDKDMLKRNQGCVVLHGERSGPLDWLCILGLF